MKILILHPIKLDGTSFYRAHGPFAHLQRMYPEIEVIDASSEEFVISWTSLVSVDLIFLQRPSTEHELTVIKIAKKALRPVWVDYDDDYFNIPSTNPRAELYGDPTRQSMVKECMELSDVITVSTPALKKSIDQVVPGKNIIVLENAFDPSLFANVRYVGPRNKIILWRGGDTHAQDLLTVKDQILRAIKTYPEYKWAFMGYCPLWITEDLDIPADQIMLYDFMDIMTYFDILMQLRPEILIVPLEQNAFNEGKSNISWIEGTLAGAAVLAPNMEKFRKGCALYNTPDEFEAMLQLLISDQTVRREYYTKSQKAIPNLQEVNIQRLQVAYLLQSLDRRLKPTEVHPKSFTDLEIFEYAMKRGHIQENPGYTEGHHKLAEWLQKTYNIENMVEFGCGPGAVIEKFLMLNVVAHGLDINPHMLDYFVERNPVFSEYVKLCDFTKDFKATDVFDLGVSIEVFEHISMPEEDWDAFITMLAKHFRWFYFTSTPYHTSEEFDTQWNHVNLRRYEKWKELFERNGWEWTGNPRQIVKWDMMLKSRLADVVTENVMEVVK